MAETTPHLFLSPHIMFDTQRARSRLAELSGACRESRLPYSPGYRGPERGSQ